MAVKRTEAGLTMFADKDWLAVWLGFLIIVWSYRACGRRCQKFRWATDGGSRPPWPRRSQRSRGSSRMPGQGRERSPREATALKRAMDAGDPLPRSGTPPRRSATRPRRRGRRAQEEGATSARSAAMRGLRRQGILGGEHLEGGRAGGRLPDPRGHRDRPHWERRSSSSSASRRLRSRLALPVHRGQLHGQLLGARVRHLRPPHRPPDQQRARRPGWLREAVRTEYYIKTGLVISGPASFFRDRPGRRPSASSRPSWSSASSGTPASGCGGSSGRRRVRGDTLHLGLHLRRLGGHRACGAIQGDKKKLSYVTSLVLIVAVPMMVLMPLARETLRDPRYRRRSLARRDARHQRLRGGGRRPHQRARHEGRGHRQVLPERSHRRGGLPAVRLVDVQGGSDRLRPERRVIWERFPSSSWASWSPRSSSRSCSTHRLVSATKGTLRRGSGRSGSPWPSCASAWRPASPSWCRWREVGRPRRSSSPRGSTSSGLLLALPLLFGESSSRRR